MLRTNLRSVLIVVTILGGWCRGDELPERISCRIPAADREILGKVADEYGLTGETRLLLFAIRIQENGPAGREMGVLTPRARRYKGDHAKSLRIQAQWAAGTIKKRYSGNLEAFAARWCPLDDPEDKDGLNRNWLPNVRALMGKNLH